MAVDLHTHSAYSDGSDKPADLVAKAARAGLEAVALTDHDNLDGITEALEAAEELDRARRQHLRRDDLGGLVAGDTRNDH